MARFLCTVGLSAFLLFQVQPLIAKKILPWFGGTPNVWATCMLFFQLLLLVGYGYAHFVTTYLKPRAQFVLHSILILISLASLPIVPRDFWKPEDGEGAVFNIIILLLFTVGLPYAILSTTGPLMQAWYAKSYPGSSPYRLFALSNAGSLVALLTYPFLVEPWLRWNVQAYTWSAGYVLFGISLISTGLLMLRQVSQHGLPETEPNQTDESTPPVVLGKSFPLPDAASTQTPIGISSDVSTSSSSAKPPIIKAEDEQLSYLKLAMWLLLSLFPSALLVATTTQVSLEVAVVPFLWILPLSLYLLSFIICFDSPKAYFRPLFVPLLVCGIVGICFLLSYGVRAPFFWQLLGYNGGLFACCMTCHGELARLKPTPRHLTLFYFIMSIGGALGSSVVVLLAPLVFERTHEFHFALAGCYVLTCAALMFDFISKGNRLGTGVTAFISSSTSVALAATLFWLATTTRDEVVARYRSFYSSLTVTEGFVFEKPEEDAMRKRTLVNGRITHGSQMLNPDYAYVHGSYYAESSGVGLAIEKHPKLDWDKNATMKVGVIGLGTGTLATYARPNDTYVFYDIDPTVIQVAQKHFTYIEHARQIGANIEFQEGDARIRMEKQLNQGEKQNFDVIAVDAFSSDAIPMHLLTIECVELYKKHLNKDGLIAVHISNRFLELEPIVKNVAAKVGMEATIFDFGGSLDENGHKDMRFYESDSTWVVLSFDKKFPEQPYVADYVSSWPKDLSDAIWSDDFGSLLQVLRRTK